MQVYCGHYGEGLGNVLAGMARSAITLVAHMVKRLGSTLINKGLRTLYSAMGGGLKGPGRDGRHHKGMCRVPRASFLTVRKRRRRRWKAAEAPMSATAPSWSWTCSPQFNVTASPEDYVNLGRTTLQLQLAVCKRGTGGAILADQQVVPIQLLLHSLF